MSRVYIKFDDLDLPVLEMLKDMFRENRCFEALISKQNKIITSLSAEIEELKKQLGLPQTGKEDEQLANLKELLILEINHLFWSRGHVPYTDPYTGEVDQKWRPPVEREQDDAKKLALQNPKIIDLLLYQTRRRKEEDDDN